MKWKLCHKNRERGCCERKGEDWCSYLRYGTEILSQCCPPTAPRSKGGTFAWRCLQTMSCCILTVVNRVTWSTSATRSLMLLSVEWAQKQPRYPFTYDTIYNLYNLPRKGSDLTATCFKSCTGKHNLYVFCLFFCSSEVWSAIETNEQRNDLVMHSLDNLNRRRSVINGFSDLFVQCAVISKANILKQHKVAWKDAAAVVLDHSKQY